MKFALQPKDHNTSKG